jgi:predicted branched-subunit amino acid permease
MSPMSRANFIDGLRGGFPIALASAPFGALFGALAADHGMSLFELTFMSATVYAGASQMVGIELFGHDVQAWLIVASILAVNFRHVLYSAAIAPYIKHFSPRCRNSSPSSCWSIRSLPKPSSAAKPASR